MNVDDRTILAHRLAKVHLDLYRELELLIRSGDLKGALDTALHGAGYVDALLAPVKEERRREARLNVARPQRYHIGGTVLPQVSSWSHEEVQRRLATPLVQTGALRSILKRLSEIPRDDHLLQIRTVRQTACEPRLRATEWDAREVPGGAELRVEFSTQGEASETTRMPLCLPLSRRELHELLYIRDAKEGFEAVGTFVTIELAGTDSPYHCDLAIEDDRPLLVLQRRRPEASEIRMGVDHARGSVVDFVWYDEPPAKRIGRP